MDSGKALEHSVGHRIRSVRREKGYSLNLLAQRAKISNAYLSKVERGLAKPSDDVLSRILAALDVSHAALAEREIEVTLSPREQEILRVMAEGLANKQIAAHLRLAEDTVKRHVQTLIAKLQASDPAQAPHGMQLSDSHMISPSSLIIECDTVWQKILSTLLVDEGFSVEAASDRDSALELMKANTYDLVTLDLTLDPEKRFHWGIQLLENLKASGYKLPAIIVVSGTDNIEVVIDTLNHYPVAYFARKQNFYQSATRREFRGAILRIAAKVSRV